MPRPLAHRPSRRPRAAAVAAVGALALLLAGCSGGDDDASPSTSASADATESAAASTAEGEAALAEVEVTGDAGAQPTVTLPSTPFDMPAEAAVVLTEGDGATLAEGQLVLLHSTWVSGTDGSALGSTYETGSSEPVTLDTSSLPQVLIDALVGSPVGTRLLYGAPGTDGTRVAVVDVDSAVDLPDRAEGTAVAPAEGLPTVTLAEDGAPSITTVAGDPPAELVSQTLIQGTGAEVVAGDQMVVKYTGWLWDGTQFDSSWDRGATFPLTLADGGIISGWVQGLAGATVGSQVLLVIPPDLGYGDQDNGTIPANSTLVFVVDILWASSGS